MDNAELFDTVILRKGGHHRKVLGDIIIFLSGLRGLWPEQEAERLLPVQTLREMEEALMGFAPEMPEEQDSELRFLTSFHGPLCLQFQGYFAEAGTLHVAAPYFGCSTAGLASLKSQLSPARIRVFPAVHSGDTVDIPLREVSKLSGVSVLPLGLGEAKRGFCHLKVYGFDSAKGQWLFTTSANCTTAALQGDNVEAGLMRRAKKNWLKEYFASRSGDSLPTTPRDDAHGEARHVLLVWAADRTGAIELQTTHQEGIALPLQEVVFTLQIGGEVSTHEALSLFDDGLAERIPWEWFPHKGDRAKFTPLLTVSALSATGMPVEGAAFVDHPLLLTSDPVHRSAWRATVALLDTEGLPEAADLASIFTLVHGVFDQHDAATPHPAETAQGASPGQDRGQADKVAIWPPEPDQSGLGHPPRGGQNYALHWFQRILAELLHGPPVERAGPRDEESDDEDATEAPAPSPRVRKAAQSAWDHTEESFEQLLRKLAEHDITREAAPKIWPVSVAILLVALATRRQSVRLGGALRIPSSESILSRFLRALFKDRCTGGMQMMDDANGETPTEPSVAEILHSRFSVRPAEDIADILLLAFASIRVRHERSRRHFPLNEWLVFREVAPQAVPRTRARCEELRPTAQRFFADETEAVEWEHIAAAVQSIGSLDWDDHPGLRELRAILAKANGEASSDAHQVPQRLRDLWYQVDSRRRRGKRWRYTVDRFSWSCPVPDCISNAVLDPHKKVLWELRPTICGTCGAVLVPERLAVQLESAHEPAR
jgi:hypothetical protein